MGEAWEPGHADALPPELLALRHRYVEQLPESLAAIQQAFDSLSCECWDMALAENLHRMVHSLTGTAGTFGLPNVSNAARQLELQLGPLLASPSPPDAGQWQVLGVQLATILATGRQAQHTTETALHKPLGAPPPPATATQGHGQGPRIHFVCDALESARPVLNALVLEGYRVEVFESPLVQRIAAERMGAEAPAAILLDMHRDGSASATPHGIRQLGMSAIANTPIFVGATVNDLATRIELMRAGAKHCLLQPLDPSAVVEALNAAVGLAPTRPWRVLLVDDEPMVLQAHAVYLRQAGMDVHTLSDPMRTLEEVSGFKPDVLVLDVYMPEVSGPEIAAALRESNVCPHLAIVFLSAETDMTQQLVALDLGGDDFLIKPVLPTHLVAAVTARARRSRHNQVVQTRLETTVYEREREHLALNEHAIVSMANVAGEITYANDMFCAVSGYSREQVLGENHRLIKSDEHDEDFFRNMWSTISSGRVWQGEICNRRRDGSLFWVESTITPFVDATGMPYQYVSIRTDISHIKQAEAKLRKQRDMQRMISVAAAQLMAAPAHLTNDAIQAALKASGELLGADNALVFRVHKDGTTMHNTHYWSANGKTHQRQKVAVVPLQEFSWMAKWFSQKGIAVLPDTDLLPSEAAAERGALDNTRTRAMIAAPIMKRGQIAGFVGYSALQPMPEWTPEVSELLNVLSEVIAGALARQRSEVALRESEARLSFLVSSSPVTIYTRSQEAPFHLLWVSDNVQKLMGLDRHSLMQGQGAWFDRVHPDDRRELAIAIHHMLDGNLHQREYRVRFGDGPYRWVQDQIRLARDDNTGKAELVGYWMDITERKRIESELERFNHDLEHRVAEQTQSVIESERFARATLDALDARVAILDADGQIIAMNRAWQVANADATTAAKADTSYLVHCDDLCGTPGAGPRPIASGIQAVISGETDDFFYEYACPRAAQPRWFVCRVKRFQGSGAVRVVVSHEDITAMKLIERQQMRSQRMESLGTLAGGVAHDLNNSLAPILMGMGILEEQFPQEKQLISMINNSAKRGADMVRQLLAFAKGVDGQRIAVQPGQIVVELEGLMKGSFPKNIELQVNVAPGLPTILGDATQLHQILLNLCVNARDAMPHGGVLTVDAQAVDIDERQARTVSEAKPGRYVCLQVSDTGEGIAADVLDRIFDPFFTTKSQEKGTGLGLSTVLGIIKGHGGFVQVQSALGKGSKFSVHLPVQDSAASNTLSVNTGQSFRGQGELVLFVDDEPVVRQIAQTVLQRLNVTPMLAVDGEDALIKATENRAELKAIITDMHMPHMDGLAFVHAVRRTLPDIPIILASGRVDDAVAKEFRALGVATRLDKPFSEAQLGEKLRSVLTPLPAP